MDEYEFESFDGNRMRVRLPKGTPPIPENLEKAYQRAKNLPLLTKRPPASPGMGELRASEEGGFSQERKRVQRRLRAEAVQPQAASLDPSADVRAIREMDPNRVGQTGKLGGWKQGVQDATLTALTAVPSIVGGVVGGGGGGIPGAIAGSVGADTGAWGIYDLLAPEAAAKDRREMARIRGKNPYGVAALQNTMGFATGGMPNLGTKAGQIQAGVGAGIGGAFSAGSQAIMEGKVDPLQVLLDTGFGATQSRDTVLGEAGANLGKRGAEAVGAGGRRFVSAAEYAARNPVMASGPGVLQPLAEGWRRAGEAPPPEAGFRPEEIPGSVKTNEQPAIIPRAGLDAEGQPGQTLPGVQSAALGRAANDGAAGIRPGAENPTPGLVQEPFGPDIAAGVSGTGIGSQPRVVNPALLATHAMRLLDAGYSNVGKDANTFRRKMAEHFGAEHYIPAIDAVDNYLKQNYSRRGMAARVAARLSEAPLTTLDATKAMMGDQPEYLDGVIDHVMAQREKIKKGEINARDLAKAYYMSVASQQADAINPQILRDATGIDFTEPFVEGDKIRPEDAAAQWLFEPEGQKALNAIEAGTFDPEAWNYGVAVRKVFGNDQFGALNVFGTPAPGTYNMTNIGDLVAEINAAKGDPDKILAAISKLNGIKTAKTPFMGHLLGIGEYPTMDAVEINYMLTGQGDVSKLKSRAAELARQVKQTLGTKAVGDVVTKRIRSRFAALQKAGVGADLSPEVAGAVMHQWLWDKARGTKTTGAGMYAAQRFAGLTPGLENLAIAAMATPETAGASISVALGYQLVKRVMAQAKAAKADPDTKAAIDSLPPRERSSLWETLSSLRKASLLSWPGTHLRNLTGNTLFQAMETAAKIPASIADIAMSAAMGTERTTGFAGLGYFNALQKAATRGLDEAAEIIRTGKVKDDVFDMGKVLEQAGVDRELYTKSPLLNGYVNGVFRLLSAEDRIFKTYALTASLEEQARIIAMNEVRRARKESGPVPNAKNRRAELLAKPTEAMIAQAVSDAEVSTFNNSNKVASAWTKFRGGLADGGPKGAAVLGVELLGPTFVATPTNVLARTLEYAFGVPALAVQQGIIRPGQRAIAGANLKRANTNLAKATKAQADALKTNPGKKEGAEWDAAKERFKNVEEAEKAAKLAAEEVAAKAFTPGEQKQIATLFGRGMVGSAAILMGYILADKGEMTGYNAGNEDREDREKNQQREATLKIGGKWLRVDSAAPFGSLLALGATLRERREYYNDANGFRPVEAFALGIGAGARTAAQNPLTKSAEDLPSGLDIPELARFAGSQARSAVPGVSILSNVATGLDTVERKASKTSDIGTIIGDRMRMATGVDRGSLPSGETKPGGAQGVFIQAFDPFQSKEGGNSNPDLFEGGIRKRRITDTIMSNFKGMPAATQDAVRRRIQSRMREKR